MSDVNAESLLAALGLQRTASSIGSVATAMVVGLAVGGILGLVFAPKSGKETVKDLRRQLDEAKDDVVAAARRITNDGEDARPAGA